MEFIKRNFLFVLVLILIGIIFVERWEKVKIVERLPSIVRDTVWVKTSNTINTKPLLTETILPTIVEKYYIADTNKVKLTEQYNELVKLYLSKNIHKDTIKIDSIGSITITDTVTKNLIKGRKVFYDLKYPVITNTITLSYKPRNQLYYGGGVQGNLINPINQVDIGILYKNKKDQIYGGLVGLDINGQVQYGLKMYWKLSFRKNDN